VSARVRPYGDRALLVEVGDSEQVAAWVDAWVDALGECAPPGVADVVPAARTVLVLATDGTDVGALRQALLQVVPLAPGRAGASSGTVEIPVRYDGPDLAEVSRLTGLSPEEVVAAHTGARWRVAFAGFAPGFAYLVGDDPRLQVPRRDDPRASVPSGSVALAGEYTGVYPRSSPGGWQLIGTTDAPMWDLDRDPPALLRVGTDVRFVARRARG
jgi:KipI family sensor histidine kinase inhibitor